MPERSRLILVLISEQPPILKPAIATGPPDTHGQVTLASPLEGVEEGEALAFVDASKCYEFDASLMRKVNAIAAEAMDSLLVAHQWIELRARLAFGPEELTTNVTTH